MTVTGYSHAKMYDQQTGLSCHYSPYRLQLMVHYQVVFAHVQDKDGCLDRQKQ